MADHHHSVGSTDWLDSLDPEQREAVTHEGGPLLIVAGPGTGKTRTLTARIAYLIRRRRVAPYGMLAVTFSNRAANELRARLTSILPDAAAVTVCTFHGLCWRILRHELGDSWALCAEERRLAWVRQVLRDRASHASKVAQAISRLKNNLIDWAAEPIPPEAVECGLTVPIAQSYQAVLDQNSLLDFDDLILRTVQIFESSSEALHRQRQRFQHIAIDEFQDTNVAQFRLMELLVNGGQCLANPSPRAAPAETPAGLTAIGDPDQAIYRFRGASSGQFQRFERAFGNARTLYLSRCYRCTPAILEVARAVIQHNRDRCAGPLVSHAGAGPKIELRATDSEQDEAQFVLREIRRLLGGLDRLDFDRGDISADEPAEHFSFADFAVLYRLHAIGTAVAQEFERSSIPFQRIGGPLLREQEPMRDPITLLRWFANPQDGWSGAQLASDQVRDAVRGVREQLRQSYAVIPAVRVLERLRDELRGLTQLVTMPAWERLQALAGSHGGTFSEFLERTDLEDAADLHDPRADKVTLMTFHAAKGLEFAVVFLVGCESGIMPYQPPGQVLEQPSEIEEERRLFYVGLTRARRRLYLSYSASRFLFGARLSNPPSPFLHEIPKTLEHPDSPTGPIDSRRTRRGPAKQRTLFRA
jgi:DNA helicase-2/ATP-dependent DNA helicase PcrA